jgi:hypothetical protein
MRLHELVSLARDDLQVADHLLGQLPAVAFDVPDDDVGTTLPAAAPLAEHGVGLPDARGHAEVDPEVTGGLDRGGVTAGQIGSRGAHGPILAVAGRPGQQEVAKSQAKPAWSPFGSAAGRTDGLSVGP